MTDPNELAAESSSAASPSQAAAAASIGSDPGPLYIRIELISGGNTKKLTACVLPVAGPEVRVGYTQLAE
ncbi:hypothetical protein MSAS_49580 [Mycobacterium saskatchewanense]|nr:hypothetical protein MSAS_49580 [Mycobacterium saskatchewanense]